MALEQITDHVQRGLAKRISQYLEKPLLERWIAIYLKQVQLFEDALWGVLISRSVDTAVGVNLDALGRIVGQPRRGQTDDQYRIYIRAKIIVNLSRGRWPELWDLARLLLPKPEGGGTLDAIEGFPGSYTFQTSYPVVEPEVVHELFQRASSAGVRFYLVWQETPPDDEHGGFIFGTSTYDDTVNGFGTESGTTGGRLASVL